MADVVEPAPSEGLHPALKDFVAGKAFKLRSYRALLLRLDGLREDPGRLPQGVHA